MKYGAFGLVEVLGSSNAILVIDQMLKHLKYPSAPGIRNAEDTQQYS